MGQTVQQDHSVWAAIAEWFDRCVRLDQVSAENARLRKELAERDMEINRLTQVVSDTYWEGQCAITQLSRALHDALDEKAELERRFFEGGRK